MKYLVEEYPEQNGKWGGYKISAGESEGKKWGKLYKTTDGRENYQSAPKKDESEELEI